MKTTNGICRVCKNIFFKNPVLEYKNMPAMAQFLPKKSNLGDDKGVFLNLYQCSGCGLIQLDSRPVPYFRQVIRSAGVSEEMKEFRQKQFKEFIEKYLLENKKIIEIGCGGGEYLEIMGKNKVDTYGLEYSKELVDKCVNNGLNVFRGYASENNKIKESLYDGFFILNFLEHLPDINSVLRGIWKNLSDNAVGLVEVPNFDMIIENCLFSELTRDHLFYFTNESLKTVLELNGFEVIEINIVWHKYIISAVVRKRVKLSLAHFYECQKKLKKEVNGYISSFKKNKVAIWGAGHQSLALMSMLDLGGKVKYVVDSAVFKQGKYTPATHIPIVSPERLDSDPVEAVIVMAASYSDEVVKTIKNRFDKVINITVLRNLKLEKI